MRPLRACAALTEAALLAGCELEQVTIVEVVPVVVAEVYAGVAEDPAANVVRAFLHWTAGTDTTGLAPLSGARITLARSDGFSTVLDENPLDECAGSFPPGENGSACFLAGLAAAPLVRPGDLLEIDIELPAGGRLSGAARVPNAFALQGLPAACRLDPDRLLPIGWTRSEGAWAYVNETSIRGLPEALAREGIEVEEDPLYLLGLSISDDDTSIVFPREFGVFNRFDLDQAVAVRLQSGLPETASAEITITAVDRNYVNWARGGNFNPSGQVRVPSLVGDGTGVFAATVSRRFVVITQRPGGGGSTCPGQIDP